ncbi:MAG: YhcN/YlaJ family sporulation lipoprotein [Paenibacillaceae bacterium]
MRLFVVSFIAVVLVTGCSNTKDDASSSPINKSQKIRVQQTVPHKPEIKNSDDVVQRLEKLATSVPHVIAANCVVVGDTAIVGINVDGNLERARVGTIKYSVAEALRKDPVGIQAIVTADIDIGNRLREMNTDIKNGKPVSGFAQELADIIGRIIPQLPRDIESPQDNQSGDPSTKSNHDRKQLKNRSV